jgi:hypothetical protein
MEVGPPGAEEVPLPVTHPRQNHQRVVPGLARHPHFVASVAWLGDGPQREFVGLSVNLTHDFPFGS